jgi:hypothetical protein
VGQRERSGGGLERSRGERSGCPTRGTKRSACIMEDPRCLGNAEGGSGEGGLYANETVSLAPQGIDAANQLFRGERMLARQLANLLVPRLKLVDIVNPLHVEEVAAEVIRDAV